MMYSEFLELSKQDITYQQYTEVIEPMYNAVEQMTKQDFINFMLPSIKALAKQNAKEKDAARIANQKTVFITTGRKTPNGCYYLGVYAKLVATDINVKTGKKTVKVRELTDGEERELAKHWNNYCNSSYDYMTSTMSITVGETQSLVDCLDNAELKWVKR